MAATNGYQAGTEANATLLSYGVEATWGTLPASQFQALRYMSESLAFPPTRARPSEISPNREQIQGVTTQQAVSGSINYALSYGTYDDLISVLLGADWQAAQTINGVAGDITLTNLTPTTATLSSTTANKFQNLAVGQWSRTLGFTNTGNNNPMRVSAKASGQSLTVTTPFAAVVTETPAGVNAKVRAQNLQNGTQFKSIYLQQKFASNLFLRYPGLYVSGMTLTGGIGQFLNGAFTCIGQQEINQTTDASTGAVLAAPTGSVMDPITGFAGVLLNEVALGSVLTKFSLNIQNTGAAAEFGMGSSAAQGILAGEIDVSGSFQVYFRDFTLYTKFATNVQGTIEFLMKDAAGNMYVVTLLNAALVAGNVGAGGANQPVYADFTIEGNPQAAGGTIMFDKLPNA